MQTRKNLDAEKRSQIESVYSTSHVSVSVLKGESQLYHSPTLQNNFGEYWSYMRCIHKPMHHKVYYIHHIEVGPQYHEQEWGDADGRNMCKWPQTWYFESLLHHFWHIQKYNGDEQDNCNLHNCRTNSLHLVLLHKYHNNIHLSHLQQYNKG